MAKAQNKKIFNDQKRKVYRKRISPGEIGFSAFFVVFVALMWVWFATRQDKYDPGERDIAMELLIEDSVVDNLYRTPFQPWVDPSLVPAGGSGGVAAPQIGIFPPAVLDGGWLPTARVKEYDKDSLFEKINGGDQQYFQFGFVAMHYVTIRQADQKLELSIEMYDMGNFENTLGIFTAQRPAEREVEARGDAHFYKTGVGAIGLVNQYYYKLYGDVENPAYEEKALQIIDALASSELGVTTYPPIYQAFARELNVPFYRIWFEKNDVFQFAFAQNFWFAKPSAEEDLRYFAHLAESPDAAAALHTQLVEANLADYEMVSKSDTTTILKHKFLDEHMAVSVSDTLVFGLEAAPVEFDVEASLTELINAVFGTMSSEEG